MLLNQETNCNPIDYVQFRILHLMEFENIKASLGLPTVEKTEESRHLYADSHNCK